MKLRDKGFAYFVLKSSCYKMILIMWYMPLAKILLLESFVQYCACPLTYKYLLPAPPVLL